MGTEGGIGSDSQRLAPPGLVSELNINTSMKDVLTRPFPELAESRCLMFSFS